MTSQTLVEVEELETDKSNLKVKKLGKDVVSNEDRNQKLLKKKKILEEEIRQKLDLGSKLKQPESGKEDY